VLIVITTNDDQQNALPLASDIFRRTNFGNAEAAVAVSFVRVTLRTTAPLVIIPRTGRMSAVPFGTALLKVDVVLLVGGNSIDRRRQTAAYEQKTKRVKRSTHGGLLVDRICLHSRSCAGTFKQILQVRRTDRQ
jgi:hypothetical protein